MSRLMRRLRGAQVLFKVYRHLPRSKQTRPVMVHINYHPGAPRAICSLPGTRLVSRRACLAAADLPMRSALRTYMLSPACAHV